MTYCPLIINFLGQIYPISLRSCIFSGQSRRTRFPLKRIYFSFHYKLPISLRICIFSSQSRGAHFPFKRDDFSFHITNRPFPRSNVPSSRPAPRANESFILRPRDFPRSFSSRDTPWNTWNRNRSNSMVDTVILLHNVKTTSPECSNENLEHDHIQRSIEQTWHCNPARSCYRILPFNQTPRGCNGRNLPTGHFGLAYVPMVEISHS